MSLSPEDLSHFKSLRVHDDLEMWLVLGGHIRFFLGSGFGEAKAGQLAVLWGGVPHTIVNVAPNSDYILCVVPLASFFTWPVLEGLRARLMAGEFVVDADGETWDVALPTFTRWVDDLASENPERASVALLEMEACVRRLGLALKDKPARLTTHTSVAHIQAVTAMVAENFQSDLSVKSIAAHVGLDPKYLSRLFRKSCGLSLWEYVRRFRLAQAQRLLLTTDMAISAIGYASGFGSQSQFYEAFRQYLGRSPREYRDSRAQAPPTPT